MAFPAAPKTIYDRDFGRGFRLSVAAHVALALLLLIKAIVLPGKPIPLVPTLRVDVVGLPDLLKQELKNAPDARANSDAIEKALKQAEDSAKKVEPPKALPKTKEPVEKAEPDEMVLKPKQIQVTQRDKLREKEKHREKKLLSALNRIRALEKISDEVKPHKTGANATLIKGNKISKGSSLSGDAIQSDVASYYDSIRDRLQNNWEIPIWFKNQGFSAKVQIFIDRSGRLRNFRFIKPSGNAQFDDAVKRTVSESQPFPVPPDDVVSTVLVDGILVGFPL
jgi:colicin import membrane protein